MKKIALLLGSVCVAASMAACSSTPKTTEAVTTTKKKAAPTTTTAGTTAGQEAKTVVQKAASDAAREIQCQGQEDKTDTRMIQMDDGEAGCKVTYVKNGTPTTVAEGRSSSPVCTEVFERIHTNLEKNGFSCQ